MPGTVGGRPGLRRLLVSYLAAASWLVPHTADLTPQHRVLVPEHQQFSSLHPVTAERQDSHAEHSACPQVEDLEQHPASQPSPHQACWR